MERIAISEVIKNPTLLNKENYFGFYDWYCKESSLADNYKHLLPKLKFLVKIGLIDADNSYVWFKNNSPINGHTYNDINIASLKKDNAFFGGICPKNGHTVYNDKCTVWYFDEKGILTEEDFASWSEFKKEIVANTELFNTIKNAWSKNGF